jgi:hypothetical protein
LSEDERLGDLLSDIITQFGELRRRVEALEEAKGGGATGGGEGVTRLDPKTGQEYRAVTVWVPEGLGDEAAALMRDLVLDRLASKAEQAGQTKLHTLLWVALRDQKLPQEPLLLSGAEPWRPLVREFAAAWTDRDPAVLKDFASLLAKHLAPFLQRMKQIQGGDTPAWPGPATAPAPETEARDAYDRMQSGLRPDWRCRST